MAIPTAQLFPRQEALLASVLPKSIDMVILTGGGAAVTYTVPAATGIIVLSTDKACLFRDGAATAVIAGNLVGEASAWLIPGERLRFRVAPGDTISFISDDVNDANVAIERYTGTNATLPPD